MDTVIAVDAGALADTTIDAWGMVAAGLALLVAWIASRYVRRAVRRVLDRLEGMSPEIEALAVRLSGYVVILIGVGVALAFLGADIQPLLAVAIVGAVVLALALRGIADNFAAGILLQTRHPIRVGDDIESGEHSGVVTEFNGRAVVIRTYDGRTVHLPNAELLDGPMVNRTVHGALRSDIEVRVAGDDPQAVRRQVLDTVATVAGVLGDPPPTAFLTAVDDRVTTLVRFWHAPGEGASVTSEVVASLAATVGQSSGGATVIAPPPEPPLTPPPRV